MVTQKEHPKIPPKPDRPCPMCKGSEWWWQQNNYNQKGSFVCGVCHPNPNKKGDDK